MQAVRYARGVGLSNIEARVTELAAELREQLLQIDRVAVHDLGLRKRGIVTFRKEDVDPVEMTSWLRERRINVSNSWMRSVRLDLGPRNLPTLLRASVHYFNTRDEITRFVEAVDAA